MKMDMLTSFPNWDNISLFELLVEIRALETGIDNDCR